MRLAGAIAVVAVAWSAALYIHQRRLVAWVRTTTGSAYADPYGFHEKAIYSHPSWEDPVAVLIAGGGLAVAVAISANGRNFAKPS